MADNLNVFVLDELGNNYLGMTKEQVISAIQQYLTTGEIKDVDSGFITKIQEMHKKGNIKFWIGTQAEYQALDHTEENTLYMFSDDPTINDIENAINELADGIDNLNTRLDNLGFKSAVATVVSGTETLNPSVNSLTKEGKRVFFNFEDANVQIHQDNNYYFQIPTQFRPKEMTQVYGRAEATINFTEYQMKYGFAATLVVYPTEQVIDDLKYTAKLMLVIPATIVLAGSKGIKINNVGWETN